MTQPFIQNINVHTSTSQKETCHYSLKHHAGTIITTFLYFQLGA